MSRVVPWMCRKEWLTTYNNLYNFQERKLQIQGVQRVHAWKSRSNGKLPLSIEATASLITATISDVENSENNPLNVRLTMSMAIVRFVNGMVDMEQKGVYARSVQSIADDIGLPDWLVDLRHEATHASLPSLEVLRAGCKFSLSWLNDHYWQAQIIEIKENNETLKNLVQKFVVDFETDYSLGVTKKTRKRKNTSLIKEIVQITCQYDMWDSVLDILLGKPGVLIPSAATLVQFAVEWPGITEHHPSSSADPAMILPNEAFALWSPLFKAWHKENDTYLSKLAVALILKVSELEMCSNLNVVLARYFACWIRFILLHSRSVKCNDDSTWEIEFELDYGAVLETCLRNSSSYTPVFLSLILNDIAGQLPQKLSDKLEKLSSLVYTGPFVFQMTPGSSERDVYDSLAKHCPRLADYMKSRKSTQGKNAGWQLCDTSLVSSTPVGGLIGCPPMQFEMLQLPDEPDLAQVEGGNAGCFTGLQVNNAFGDNLNINEDDFMDGTLPEMQCEISGSNAVNARNNKSRLIENISQEIWIF